MGLRVLEQAHKVPCLRWLSAYRIAAVQHGCRQCMALIGAHCRHLEVPVYKAYGA